MRVSWLTAWPSARTEIHEVSVARITRVSEGGADFCVVLVFDLARDRTVTSFLLATSAEELGGVELGG